MVSSNIQWRAVKWSALSFVVIWVAWSILTRIVIGTEKTPDMAIFYTVTIISGMAPGYIASVMAGQNYLTHSFVTGLVISALLIIFWVLIGAISSNNIAGTITTPAMLIGLSMIGGAIAKFQGKIA